jgi:hypothetical protein
LAQTDDIKRSSKNLVLFFTLGAIEGILCFGILVLLPADQKTTWLFGYSRLRVFMLVAAFLGISFFSWMIIKAKDPDWVRKIFHKLDKLFQRERTATFVLGFLLVVFMLGVIFLYSSITQTDFVVRPHLLKTIELIRTAMDRLAPFVFWLTALSLQTMVFLLVLKYGTRARYYRVLRVISIVIFPLLIGLILIIIQIDAKYYRYINQEDNLVEWLTFAFLIGAGLLSLVSAFRAYKSGDQYLWFYLLFGIACIILGFEEISWGQRIFQVESPEFFMENSDQQEINVHNVLNLWFSVRTKHVAAFVLFIFGVCLPLLAMNKKMKTLFKKLRIVVPPLFLAWGFALGAFLTLDIFSGQEEEVAELFLSLALLLFIILENLKTVGSRQITARRGTRQIGASN